MELLIAGIVILLVAIVPMVIYALVLWWFDRYEKEPLGLIVAAFLWGAVPAVIFSLIAQILFDVPISILVSPGLGSDLLGASLIAPLTEEPFKGLALLLLVLFFRREIDSPLDGVLYGGLVGFGFAATENVFYFADAYSQQGLGGVMELSLYRALLFGLNHALFTGCVGLGFGIARTSPRWLVKIGAPLLGLGAGIILHAVHNAGATLAGSLCWPLLVSLASDWLGALALLVVLVWLSFREQRTIIHYLADEVQAGAISQRDYFIIQSYWRRMGERLRVLFQANFSRWLRLGKYYRLATELAFVKQRWIAFGREPESAKRVEELRRQLYELRKML